MMPIPSPSHMGTLANTDNPTDLGIPHIDIHQELFPDYFGGPASTPCEPEHKFAGNDIYNGGSHCAPVIKENNSLPRVPPGSSGEGLPYAPIHWPNDGDVWSWRVGRKVNSYGFYSDRFLKVPKGLRKPNIPKVFSSKPSLERFLRSNFPDTDVNEFFASFVWKIPAVVSLPYPSSPTPYVPEQGMGDDKKQINKKIPHATERKRAPHTSPLSTPSSSDSKRMQKTTEGFAGPKPQAHQQLKDSTPLQSEIQDTNDGLDLSFLDNEMGRAEFDNYLNSLDEILVQPWFQEPFYQPATMHNFFAAEVEMAEAQRKLSSFLNMDFPSLICFKDVDELASLASKLQKDPTLTAEQLVKLKLIEEIPTFGIVFLENREVMEQADQFFRTLKENKAKVASLKQEYCEINQVVTNLESEVNSTTMAVQNIDDQIAQLDARRAEVMKLIDKKKRDKDELIHNQKLVANSIPKVVHEVQLANARKPEWELKKESGVRREAEILARFAPLKGFSL
ncbi:Detected protein of unknown function [Hibiscus syriacus]|uniref:DUF7081 domain-containing protein n=1 Tax=Hibiscus syriacus TaxID=106335 RepID=A0A6A3CFY5_HIBSY|nr:uncharacterized protein LOC120198702 isoform X3 [Hibiscus syriacus]XP_039055914.1 uncharacterized protein LOC120198702 isoform X3 [Hibiscus syriacus]XP_039055916.1 uncharacterized protein LOC120198702 isoform X5 [Hibiscus syriacus]KAE8728150.1 Detected protein of unknown function [Hibiscus syriacus]